MDTTGNSVERQSPDPDVSDSAKVPAPAAAPRARVLLVQRRLPRYRVALFQQLNAELRRRGVDLVLAYGDPTPSEALKRDEAEMADACRLPTRYFGEHLCWQPVDTVGYDLVIVSQENRMLFNHWLCRPWRRHRLAFFGHGANLASAHPAGLAERFKHFTTRRADWFLAYTSLSRDLVLEAGFPPERITVLNNAVDTSRLRAQLAALPSEPVERLRQTLGLTPGHTGLFMGSLYAGKAIDLLLAAAARCAARTPGFRLVIVGDGPAAPQVREAAARHAWLHWAGARHGDDRLPYLAVADFMLMPGSVGLAILDGFAAGLPILSTRTRGHGPEIVYLSPGENGEMTPHEPEAYAAAIQQWMDAPQRLAALRAGALQSGQRYSLEAMVANFADGVLAALHGQRPR
jgi:L-malate glycosyltransferase